MWMKLEHKNDQKEGTSVCYSLMIQLQRQNRPSAWSRSIECSGSVLNRKMCTGRRRHRRRRCSRPGCRHGSYHTSVGSWSGLRITLMIYCISSQLPPCTPYSPVLIARFSKEVRTWGGFVFSLSVIYNIIL